MRRPVPKSLLVLLLVLLAACESRVTPTRQWRPEDHGQPAELDPARTPTEPSVDEPEQGGVGRAAEALFTVSCAGCHGRDGRGLGPMRPPGAQLPDFSSAAFQAQRSDAQLTDVIMQGKGMMPPFGKQVNPQGIAALVGYVRALGVTPAASAAPAAAGAPTN